LLAEKDDLIENLEKLNNDINKRSSQTNENIQKLKNQIREYKKELENKD